MSDEFDEEDAIRIASDSAGALPFFQRILDDPSILDRIPRGGTITILPTPPDGQRAAAQQATSAGRAVSAFEVGDQTVSILDVPAKDYAAD